MITANDAQLPDRTKTGSPALALHHRLRLLVFWALFAFVLSALFYVSFYVLGVHLRWLTMRPAHSERHLYLNWGDTDAYDYQRVPIYDLLGWLHVDVLGRQWPALLEIIPLHSFEYILVDSERLTSEQLGNLVGLPGFKFETKRQGYIAYPPGIRQISVYLRFPPEQRTRLMQELERQVVQCAVPNSPVSSDKSIEYVVTTETEVFIYTLHLHNDVLDAVVQWRDHTYWER